MANTRIRYEKVDDNTLTSRRVFELPINNGTESIVILDTLNMKFSITDIDGKVLASGGNTKNLAVLKIQAKNGLRELGYEFGSETRIKAVASSTVDSGVSEAISAAGING